MSRVRIPIGRIVRYIWRGFREQHIQILIGVAALHIAFAISCPAATVVLPYLNGDGYATVNVFVNRSAADVTIDLFPDQSIGFMGKTFVLPADSFARRPSNDAGLGVRAFSLPDGVDAYAEIATPHGAIARIGKAYGTELVASDQFDFVDLQPNTRTNAGVFIVAKSETSVTVPGSPTRPLAAGEGVILPAEGATSSVVTLRTQLGTGQVYAFAFINDWFTGSIQIVPAR